MKTDKRPCRRLFSKECILVVLLLVALAVWWRLTPYEPVYSSQVLAAPSLFVEECRDGDTVLRIRQVAGYLVESGTALKVYDRENRDTGITVTLPAELSPGSFVDAPASRAVPPGTYFLYGEGILTTSFSC